MKRQGSDLMEGFENFETLRSESLNKTCNLVLKYF